jgi:hypothetical protein
MMADFGSVFPIFPVFFPVIGASSAETLLVLTASATNKFNAL